ncbi:MAG: DUF4339 domain-containing protein, partial [Acidobacteriota bacterium]
MSLTDLPAPDAETVYVHVDGERQGPMSRRALFDAIRAGRFDTSALFWLPSLGEEWARIGDHPDLVADLRPAVADAPAEAPAETPSFATPETRPPVLERTSISKPGPGSRRMSTGPISEP